MDHINVETILGFAVGWLVGQLLVNKLLSLRKEKKNDRLN